MNLLIKRILLLLVLMAALFTACEEVALGPKPEVNNVAVYEEYWKIYNEKYALFRAKNLDWQEVYNVTRPLVDNTISEDSLFSVLASMTISLRDGHSSIFDPVSNNVGTFDLEAGFPVNLNEQLIQREYLNGETKKVGGFTYTTLNGDIGYIIFRDFLMEIEDEQIDEVLTDLADTKGLIIDVRGNPGGDPNAASRLASHFTREPVDVGFERFKTGPNDDDFVANPFVLEPAEGVIYSKPVAVLTNRLCYSATTTFLYCMDPLPQVQSIGGFTGGGSGSVADGHLINGWIYSLSVSEFIDVRGRDLDDGVAPDILIDMDEEVTDRDEIIERAIQELSN